MQNEYRYLYETHLHTCRGSACAHHTGEEMAKAAKAYGYAGIIVTEHNWGGNTCVPRDLPQEEWYIPGIRSRDYLLTNGEALYDAAGSLIGRNSC